MLLMIENGNGGAICYTIHRYAKANNRYMKLNIKVKNRQIFNMGMQITYMDVTKIACK